MNGDRFAAPVGPDVRSLTCLRPPFLEQTIRPDIAIRMPRFSKRGALIRDISGPEMLQRILREDCGTVRPLQNSVKSDLDSPQKGETREMFSRKRKPGQRTGDATVRNPLRPQGSRMSNDWPLIEWITPASILRGWHIVSGQRGREFPSSA